MQDTDGDSEEGGTSLTKRIQALRWATLRSRPADAQNFSNTSRLSKSNFPFNGWRLGLLVTFISVALCLCIEVALLAAGVVMARPQNGTGMLYQGSCSRVRYLTIALLLPLNMIGTVLLGASNYIMQCLAAPTRKNVDKAHAAGHFVDIGPSSLQNFSFFPSWKWRLWCVLGLSTIPIHLLLNSVLFASLQANDQGVMVVGPDYLQDTTWDQCSNLTKSDLDEFGTTVSARNTSNAAADFACTLQKNIATNNTGRFTRLDPAACISRYSNVLDGTAGNVALVARESSGHWANIANGTGWDFEILPGLYSTGNLSAVNGTSSGLSFTFNPAAGEGYWNPGPQYNHTFPAPSTLYSGLYGMENDVLWSLSSVRAVWNSFDYQFWSTAQALDFNFSDPKIRWASRWQPTSWLCDPTYTLTGQNCSVSAALTNASKWLVTPKSFEIDYCMSATTDETCTLQYSSTIMITIIACGLIKLVATFITLRTSWKIEQDPTNRELVTLGDAIESFLTVPDPTSVGRCLLDQKAARDFDDLIHPLLYKPEMTLERRIQLAPKRFGPRPLPWHPHNKRWLNVPSKTRWTIFFTLYVALFASSAVTLGVCIGNLSKQNLTSLWSQGIGSINQNTLFANSFFSDVRGPTLLKNALLINSPQLLFSVLYFVYNGLYTCMVSGHEWGKFETEKEGRTLRVSQPKGRQRSSYWLSLPWWFSIPLMGASAVMHWLLSKSLFLVKIDVYDYRGVRAPDRDISACGYSALAIVLVMCMLLVMLVVLGLVGMQRLPTGIPLVGNCSWAISSACHDIAGERDAALKPLRWGVLDPGTADKPGHCSITSREVQNHVEGQIYR
jgi:hypothetical protein